MNAQIEREIIDIPEEELRKYPLTALETRLLGTGLSLRDIEELARKIDIEGAQVANNYRRYNFEIRVIPAFDDLGFIMHYENGDLVGEEQAIIEGFINLANSGTLFQLQGFYHRAFVHMLQSGYIKEEGDKYVVGRDYLD